MAKPPPRVVDMVDRKTVKLLQGTRLREAAAILFKKRLPSVPVVDQHDKLLGFFTLQSLLVALADAVHHLVPRGRVESYLAENPPSVPHDMGMMRVVQVFNEVGHLHPALPVVNEGKLVGTITRYDVVRSIYNYFKDVKDPETRSLYLSALRDEDPSPPF